ncbi:DUF6612 family protein [Macrococcus armenti]|uniref:DUF6612 family protein n=1 Tax=Macrococcus armenti TaxID=2875764 RepID=UPI001CCC0E1A|nr:DUF6612 family protein [Macrococcus armenti]UBH14750.1 hypothetical protein LAU44_08205 [Macrococcus armenti]UBH17108.1 hypothetical protein LAU39_08230 [Macrococcus armenti]UBH19374.1 hypothetical protein LAU40_08210 [Macrococcus armenti]
MKKTHILPLLLGSSLIFAACGGNEETKKSEDVKSETTQKSAEEKSDVTDAKSLIDKANEAGKDIKNYKAELNTDFKAEDESVNMKMDIEIDESETMKVKLDAQDQQMDLYIFDGKVVVSQDGETYTDATDLMGDIKNQLNELDYKATLKTLDAYKDAKFKKTDDGYELEKEIKNIDEFNDMVEKSGSTLSDINKDDFKDVKGKMTLKFDKDYLLSSADQDLDMSTSDGKLHMETEVEYDDFNKIPKIEIPEAAKKAE